MRGSTPSSPGGRTRGLDTLRRAGAAERISPVGLSKVWLRCVVVPWSRAIEEGTPRRQVQRLAREEGCEECTPPSIGTRRRLGVNSSSRSGRMVTDMRSRSSARGGDDGRDAGADCQMNVGAGDEGENGHGGDPAPSLGVIRASQQYRRHRRRRRESRRRARFRTTFLPITVSRFAALLRRLRWRSIWLLGHYNSLIPGR